MDLTRACLRHEALLYGDEAQYAAGTARFVREGLAAGEPVFISVPAGRHEVVRAALGDAAAGVRLADMTQVGRNPGRILSVIGDWVQEHAARRTRFIGEPIWPGRTPAEVTEATYHEALINLACADAPITVLCPYDVRGLAPEVVADAERTHPTLVCEAGHRHSSAYDGAAAALEGAARPLEEPDEPVATLVYGYEDLHAVRSLVREHAERWGVRRQRIADLVLAVSEAASNTVRHAGGRGTLALWADPGAVVCQFADDGLIADPLAGRRRPPQQDEGGRGLWMIHQLCDLVQVRTGAHGTTVRVHMRRT
jgi:anti-sigma regulatory factor (Ser/Thr protein kinase)